MHTLIVTFGGLLLLALCLGIATRFGKSPDSKMPAAKVFVAIWLVFCAVHFYLGVRAGHSVAMELATHLLIFGLPAMIAWYLGRSR